MNGEDFLRDLAAQIITESDVDFWWPRFSSAFEALDLVGAIDDAIAREVGEEIRAGLAEMSGEEIPRFHLASRYRPPATTRPHQVDGIGDLSGLTARSAWSPLPPEMGSGGVNFVSQTDQQCWLVCSGAGPAPWPQHEPPRPPLGSSGGFVRLRSDESRYVSAESAMCAAITDDQGGPRWLEFVSSGASSSGQKRQRWDLRTLLRPTPAENVKWLRFETPHGPITSRLLPPTAARISTEPLVQERSEVEYYLAGQLYNHVWLHLLDLERLLAGLSVIGSALVAVDAVRADHPLVVAVAAVDDAIAGPEVRSIPPVLADALARRPPPTAWVGASAVGVMVSHPDAGQVGLEALVGHPDRFALHFIDPGGGDQIGAWGLIVTATDDHGRGHVAHPEPLSSMEEGALHFRPPLAGDAAHLTIRLEGPRAAVNVTIDLADNTGVAPGS